MMEERVAAAQGERWEFGLWEEEKADVVRK